MGLHFMTINMNRILVSASVVLLIFLSACPQQQAAVGTLAGSTLASGDPVDACLKGGGCHFSQPCNDTCLSAGCDAAAECAGLPLPAEPDNELPRGSYQKTCEDCTVSGGELCCDCEDREGSLHYTCGSGCGSYENVDGRLQCE